MPDPGHGTNVHENARRNRLLAAMSTEDMDELAPHLEHVDLPLRYVLEEAGGHIDRVCFPLSGIASVVAVGNRQRDERIEAGIFGRDGMTGTAILLDAGRSPHDVFVQMPGEGLNLPVETLNDIVNRRPQVRSLFLRFIHAAQLQTAFTALANGSDNLETRLARWILMAHDRVDGDVLDLTHEFLSLMLGVRRAGVTDGIHGLEGRGIIKAQRGRITLIDRAAAIAVADGSYGKAETEYERLIGQSI